jgi:hypothetical protein
VNVAIGKRIIEGMLEPTDISIVPAVQCVAFEQDDGGYLKKVTILIIDR